MTLRTKCVVELALTNDWVVDADGDCGSKVWMALCSVQAQQRLLRIERKSEELNKIGNDGWSLLNSLISR